MTIDLAPWHGICESCAAPIVWAVTARAKKPMPVDRTPSDKGNVLLAVDNGRLVAGVLGRNQAAGVRDRGESLHLSHFATCVYASRHRRRRRG